MEPDEAAPDLVGRTSARLVAAGVDRRARVDALRLLAILDASTDLDGRVRRPLDDLAAEFELPTLGVMGSLEHLERAGAVQRDGNTVLVLGDGTGLGGMHLADFLEDVQASFDGAPAPTARRSPWLVRGGAALVAAAAAFAVVTMTPAATPTAVEQLAANTTTSTGESTPVTADEPPTSTTVADAPVPGTEPAPSTTVADAPVPGTEPAPAAPPVDTTVVAATVCPTGSPVASIVEDVVRIVNPTDEDIEITSMSVGGLTFTVPFTVPAGGSVERPIITLLTDAGPVLNAWQWINGEVARTCAS